MDVLNFMEEEGEWEWEREWEQFE